MNRLTSLIAAGMTACLGLGASSASAFEPQLAERAAPTRVAVAAYPGAAYGTGAYGTAGYGTPAYATPAQPQPRLLAPLAAPLSVLNPANWMGANCPNGQCAPVANCPAGYCAPCPAGYCPAPTGTPACVPCGTTGTWGAGYQPVVPAHAQYVPQTRPYYGW